MEAENRDKDILDAISITEYYWAVVKRKWLVLAILALALFATAIYTIRQPKVYEAAATIEIDTQTDRVLNDVREVHQLGDGSYWDSQAYYETQYEIIQSRSVAKMVVDKLYLDRDLKFLGLAEIDDESELAEALAHADAITVLQNNLRVDPKEDSRLVHIRYQSSDPQLATNVANAVAEAYIEQNLERKLSSTRNAINWLNEQTQDLKENLEKSERALYEFRKENDILSVGMDERVNILATRMDELNRQVSIAESNYLRAKAGFEAMKSALKDEKSLADLSSAEVLDNQLIKDLKITLAQLENRYTELLVKYKEKHPDVQLVKSQMERTRENLHQELQNIMGSQLGEYKASKSTLEGLQKLLDDVKMQAKQLTTKSVEYNRLQREKESNQRLFEQVMMRLKEINLSGMLKINNIRMLDRAEVPVKPIKPRIKLNLLLGLFFGLLGAVGVAVLLEAMDRTIKSTEDVEQNLKIPVLGILPEVKPAELEGKAKEKDRLAKNLADLYAHINPRSSLAECCRTIRTNINFMSPEKPLRRLLITSASPKEGKTTIVSNLGITIANTGQRVLVMDTDIRRPRIHKAFGIHNDYGLSNVIMGSMSIEEATRDTEIENLNVMTCGPIPPNPAELLGSETFKKIVQRASEMYDWILFDSPPVIAVTDASILSSLVDGVILVVKWGKTHREVAMQARRQLSDVNANVLGTIVNNLDFDSREYGSHHYYYYNRYGYYYGERQDGAESGA